MYLKKKQKCTENVLKEETKMYLKKTKMYIKKKQKCT